MDGETEFRSAENEERIYRRYKEAREYKFTERQARTFSESDSDVGLLRKLKTEGCPPNLAFRITRSLEKPPPPLA